MEHRQRKHTDKKIIINKDVGLVIRLFLAIMVFVVIVLTIAK